MNPRRPVDVFIHRDSLSMVREYVWPARLNRRALDRAVMDNAPILFITKARPHVPFTGREAAKAVDGRVTLKVFGPRGTFMAFIDYSTGGLPVIRS